MKLGPSLNVPNGSLGSFGAVTPTETPFENRTQLFDVAAAGPVLGFGVALGLFAYGLAVRSMHHLCACVTGCKERSLQRRHGCNSLGSMRVMWVGVLIH